jgi:hypothetical protein
MTTRGTSRTAVSTSAGQSAGKPIGVIPPYSIPVTATGLLARLEGRLAHIELSTDQPVDVGSGGREDDARCVPDDVTALADDDDAVGGRFGVDVVGGAEGCRVREVRVDGGYLDLFGHPARAGGRRQTAGARSSGASRARVRCSRPSTPAR